MSLAKIPIMIMKLCIAHGECISNVHERIQMEWCWRSLRDYYDYQFDFGKIRRRVYGSVVVVDGDASQLCRDS